MMKPSLIILYSVICIAAFGCGIYAGLLYEDKNPSEIAAQNQYSATPVLTAIETVSKPEPTPSPSPSANSEKDKYMLYLSDNGISVYKVSPDGKTSLVTTKEVDVKHLRQEDYERLCRGITANNREQALGLLEGFIG